MATKAENPQKNNTVVLATGNNGKVREIRAALSPFGLSLPTQAEFNIAAAAEPHPTFLENALAKARHVAAAANLPALADDSGLVVPALGNAPGVHSARYASVPSDFGDATPDARNNEKLLRAMDGVSERQAFYYALLVFVRSANDPAPLVAEGFWRGEIATAPRGDGGFGYDPLFYDDSIGKTGAEMSIAEKQRSSHRGRSLRRLARLMRWRQSLWTAN